MKGDTTNYDIFDNDGNGSLSIGDSLIFIEDYPGFFKLTWTVAFRHPGLGYYPVWPVEGDIFRITPHKPFMAPDSVYLRTGSLVGIEEYATNQVKEYKLSQNYPNPFNPATIIQYSIPAVAALSPVEGLNQNRTGSQQVTLKVYNILGKQVATLVNEQQRPGNYEVKWDAAGLATGVYFYTLRAGNFTDTKKLIVLK
jgi:hypothetical protein